MTGYSTAEEHLSQQVVDAKVNLALYVIKHRSVYSIWRHRKYNPAHYFRQ